ncbi:MAG TPA: hypothetical protein VGK42_10430 [Candidatus Dormibacteraeota bacterium]
MAPVQATAAERRSVPARLVWALVALVLGLTGWLMLINAFLGISGYVLIGVGVGIGCAVIGSLAHDALAGPRERL